MSMVSLDEVKDIVEKFEVGYNKVSPHFVPKILSNMAAGLVSMQFGIKVRPKLPSYYYCCCFLSMSWLLRGGMIDSGTQPRCGNGLHLRSSFHRRCVSFHPARRHRHRRLRKYGILHRSSVIGWFL